MSDAEAFETFINALHFIGYAIIFVGGAIMAAIITRGKR